MEIEFLFHLEEFTVVLTTGGDHTAFKKRQSSSATVNSIVCLIPFSSSGGKDFETLRETLEADLNAAEEEEEAGEGIHLL